MSVRDKRVGFVGGGNMGEALVRGLTKTGFLPAGHLLMADVRPDRLEEMKRLYGVVVVPDNAALVRRADVVILAVKPQILAGCCDEIAPARTRRKAPISVAAGVSTSEIRRASAPARALIRVMPNTPALVLEGVFGMTRMAARPGGGVRSRVDTPAAIEIRCFPGVAAGAISASGGQGSGGFTARMTTSARPRRGCPRGAVYRRAGCSWVERSGADVSP